MRTVLGKQTLARLVAVMVGAGLVSVACGDDDSETPKPGNRLEVVASFYPLTEAATRVGGDRVEVTNLTPAGVEPHDIELTPRQVDRLEDADLVLYLGQDFQPALEEIAERRDVGAVDLLEDIEIEEGAAEAEDAEHEESGLDPHFWLDPQLMAEAVDAVADALSEMSPDDADKFRANAERYKEELDALDEEFERGLSNCERKEIVTSHAAFFYLADRYGLTQLPIAGVSPEAEPDAARLATLADEVEAQGITTVFFEELVSPKVAETLARETGAQTGVLDPIEGLSQDDLDAGKDYEAVMRENLVALREALGCQ